MNGVCKEDATRAGPEEAAAPAHGEEKGNMSPSEMGGTEERRGTSSSGKPEDRDAPKEDDSCPRRQAI